MPCNRSPFARPVGARRPQAPAQERLCPNSTAGIPLAPEAWLASAPFADSLRCCTGGDPELSPALQPLAAPRLALADHAQSGAESGTETHWAQ